MMSGGRMYGGPNVLLMGNESISRSADALDALLSSSVFNGSRSVANLEEVIGNVSKRPFYNSFDQEETGDEDLDDCIHPPEKKRRLTADQVQFLERSFEIENKLEPERKIKLANELGLQPRQVAVWFQNRRARWKTKQLERDYDILKSRFENLRVDYDSLLKEKDNLRAEVTFLTGKLHSKDCDLEAQTKDSESVEKKVFLQPVSHSECVGKSERGTSVNDPPPSCKHEDPLSSGTDSSGVLDEGSPHHIDCGHSSNHVNSSQLFEADQSDLSHAEEEEEEEGMSEKLLPQTYTYHLLKVEDGPFPDASYNEMFAMEDQVQLDSWWD